MAYAPAEARRRSGSGVGGGRWDSERFARERDRFERGGSGRLVEERDLIDRSGGRFREERDYLEEDFGPPGGRSERFGGVQTRRRERSADGHFDRYGAPRRGSAFYGEDDDYDDFARRPSQSAMVPFRSPGHSRRESGAAIGRGPSGRPQFVRRQSSLDTFDRKPFPRYGDREQSVSVPFRPRRRPQRYERDYEEIRIAEPDYYGDEDFHGIRDIEIDRRAGDGSFSSYRREDEWDEVLQEERPFPRRGKTKMPRRIVHVDALASLGYPYDEEGDTVIILKALNGDQIDEVVRVSEEYRRTTYRTEETRLVPAPEPREFYERKSEYVVSSPGGPAREEVITQVTDTIREDGHKHGGHKHSGGHSSKHRRSRSHRRRSKSHGVRKSSRHRTKSRERLSISSLDSSSDDEIKATRIVQETEESEPVHGPLLALAQPDKHRRRSYSHGHTTRELVIPDRRKDERDLKNEIRALEREEKALKLERRAEREERKARRLRDGGTDYIEIERDDGVVVERNSRVPADSRLVKAMLATLT